MISRRGCAIADQAFAPSLTQGTRAWEDCGCPARPVKKGLGPGADGMGKAASDDLIW